MNKGLEGYTTPLVPKYLITGRRGGENEKIFFQPCHLDPNNCDRLGEYSQEGRGYLCGLHARRNGKIVICGHSAKVERK